MQLSVDATAGFIFLIMLVSPLNRRPARLYLLSGGPTCKQHALFNTRSCCCAAKLYTR